jgi:hypothetical protein
VTIARLALLGLLVGILFVGDVSRPIPRGISSDLGVLDGVIRSVDGRGMFVEVHYRTGGVALQRIDFGPHMVFGAAGITTTRADLVSGRAIGMLIQRQPVGPLRAMRVWLD